MSEEVDNGYAEAWRPAAGERIEGVLVSVELIDPNAQGPYPCVTLRDDDGQLRAIHAFHGVLRRELARRRPRVGDRVGISYLGKREGGQYGGYHNYKVTGGQEREFDWEQELPPEERQQQAVPIEPMPIPEPQPTTTGPSAVERDFGDVPF